jgi:ribonuclease BN (tRNA processing enzyme)
MKCFGVEPSQIEGILLTHLHGDHFGGVPFFILDAQLVSRRAHPLIVAGPPGLKERMLEAMEVLFPGSSRVEPRFPLKFIELAEEEEAWVGPLSVTPYTVMHPSGAPAYALRIEHKGKVLTYSGDTQWIDSLSRAASGADLLICEAYFFSKKVPNHLDYQTLIDHWEELDCSRLVLTHMSEDMLGRLGEVEVESAEDGKSLFL